jgi:hypothetical protein
MYEALRVLSALLLEIFVFEVILVAKVEFNLSPDCLHYIIVLISKEISCALFLICF